MRAFAKRRLLPVTETLLLLSIFICRKTQPETGTLDTVLLSDQAGICEAETRAPLPTLLTPALLPAADRIYTGKGEKIDHVEVLRIARPGG